MVPAAVLLAALLAGLAVPGSAVSTFTGESFDFMGQPGRYYSLINTPGVQVREQELLNSRQLRLSRNVREQLNFEFSLTSAISVPSPR